MKKSSFLGAVKTSIQINCRDCRFSVQCEEETHDSLDPRSDFETEQGAHCSNALKVKFASPNEDNDTNKIRRATILVRRDIFAIFTATHEEIRNVFIIRRKITLVLYEGDGC